MARPLSICQSLLSRRWSLNAACHSLQRLFTRPPLGNFPSLRRCPPPLPCPFFFPFAPLLLLHRLFYLNFTSCPFSVYYFLDSNPGSWRRRWGGGGKHAKRCGIYLSFLAPVAAFHKALWPFPFTPSSLILLPSSRLLSLPSYLSEKKRTTLVFQANLSPLWPSCYFCSFHFFYPCAFC